MPCRPALGKVCDRGGAPARDRYPEVPCPAASFTACGATRIRARSRVVALFAAAVVLSPLAAPPAAALDLFATHQVTAQFATADGKPLAGAEVRVFAPGAPNTPVATGRTDAAGKFVFDADRDGMWSAEARTSDQIARIIIRVGGGSSPDGSAAPYLVIGALAALLVAAFWYRRRRMRLPAPKR